MTTKLQNYRERHHAPLNGRTYGSMYKATSVAGASDAKLWTLSQ